MCILFVARTINKCSRAVDYAVKIRVNPQQTGIDVNVKHSMVSVFCRICYRVILIMLLLLNRILLTRLVRDFFFVLAP